MYGQGKKKNPRSATLLMDWVHICIGLLIVILAVIAFLNPEDNRVLLPVIFLLAVILNVFTGVHKYRQSGRGFGAVCFGRCAFCGYGSQCHQYLEVKCESGDYQTVKRT